MFGSIDLINAINPSNVMNLKRRVTWALTAVVTLFVATQSVLAYLSLEEQEDDLVDELVLTEARTLAQRIARGELHGPAGATLLDGDSDGNPSAWLITPSGAVLPRPLPAHLAHLADGPHRPGRPDRHLHVVVMPTTQGRLYVQYDAQQNEAKVQEFGLYLIGLALVCSMLGALLSWRVADWVVGPIERLTAHLSAWAPDDGQTRAAQTDEESRLFDAFNRVQDRFERAIAHEREFIANVGHELRTPLAALRTDLEMLASTPEAYSPPQQRLARAIAAVDAMAGSLDAVRSMTQPPRAPLHWVDLAQCVIDAWASVQPRHESSTTTLHNDVAPGQQVLADRHALLTILRNLMRNTLEHAGAQRCVVRRTARGIEVLDDGVGIPTDELPHIFERYWRGRLADSTSLNVSSTPATTERGIGLAIARQLADLNGWRLTAQHAPQVDPTFPRGTCFTLELGQGQC